MRRSLEDRRLAVVAALRAVAAEPVVIPAANPVDTRLAELAGRVDELLARLDSVETSLLETTWDQPAQEPDETAEAPVSVPALDLAEGRMSSGAARALFGH